MSYLMTTCTACGHGLHEPNECPVQIGSVETMYTHQTGLFTPMRIANLAARSEAYALSVITQICDDCRVEVAAYDDPGYFSDKMYCRPCAEKRSLVCGCGKQKVPAQPACYRCGASQVPQRHRHEP